jgi:hypothetical protein
MTARIAALCALAAALCALACAPTARVANWPGAPVDFGNSWTAERCQTLLDQRDALTWGAAFAGGLAGVGGLATAFPDQDRHELRLGLGISSAVFAAAATSMVALGAKKSDEFELYCNTVQAPADAELVEAVPVVETELELELVLYDGGVE